MRHTVPKWYLERRLNGNCTRGVDAQKNLNYSRSGHYSVSKRFIDRLIPFNNLKILTGNECE